MLNINVHLRLSPIWIYWMIDAMILMVSLRHLRTLDVALEVCTVSHRLTEPNTCTAGGEPDPRVTGKGLFNIERDVKGNLYC